MLRICGRKGIEYTDMSINRANTPMVLFRLIGLILLSLFFTGFGIFLLITAYDLNDPFSFIMSFFAANLVILISATLTLGFTIQLVRFWRLSQRKDLPLAPHENRDE